MVIKSWYEWLTVTQRVYNAASLQKLILAAVDHDMIYDLVGGINRMNSNNEFCELTIGQLSVESELLHNA